jgi:hypothetical protein
MSFRKKKLLLFLTLNALLINNSWSQSPARMANFEYMQTRLSENFSTAELDRDVWRVASNIKKSNLYIFADSAATVNQTEEGLGLSMLHHPGYTTKIWSPDGEKTVEADFIAGEVMTVEDYSYGIFECSATFARGNGSFPAFWLYNDTMCFESERPEIDIAELKSNRRNPTLDNNIWYYPADCLPHTSHEFAEHRFSWEGTHTFKGIWTPERIEFYADNQLLKVVENTGQHWYPRLPQHVVLSQQVTAFGRLFPDTERIITPQTSWFHWVRVKEFFLAPEINCPDNVEHIAIATLDVDKAASEIRWELTPERLFSGKTSGSGLKATIKPAKNFHGRGKIIYRFEMPSGESFTTEKEFWINGLHHINKL